MSIKTEVDITPEASRKLRTDAKLTQREFWESVGSNQASGHWFEVGKRKRIPKPIRMLIFLRYVVGLEFVLDNEVSASSLIKIGEELSAKIAAQRAAEAATQANEVARQAARKAKELAAA
jgi:hypothetical protein